MGKYNLKYTNKYIIFFILSIVLILYIIYDPFKIHYNPTKYEIPFFIKHTDTSSPRSISNVPLTIYESWHSNYVPEKMKENIYKMIEMNPQFDYYLYSDDACLNFIKENFDQDVVNAFNILKPGAYKSDLWRYCILYKKGGVYLDIKYSSLVPLIDIVKENPTIFVKDLILCSHKAGIYNAFMVSPPNNIIFKKCIDDIVYNCKNKLYKRNCLDITGPCLLREIVIKEKSEEYINTLKFHIKELSDGHRILYNNKEILKIYNEYRKDQKYFQKTKYYRDMWNNKDVYN